MLSYFDLRKGTIFLYRGKPFEVLDFRQTFKGRGSAVANVKIRNIISGQVLEKTFHQGETFDEADIKKIKAIFIYAHRGKYVFSEKENPKNRFEFTSDELAEKANFLIPNLEVEILKFEGEAVGINLPVKIRLRVVEAPPSLRRERAQSPKKKIKLETGLEIDAPSFIKEGDVVEVNTETKEYVKKIES